MQNDKIIFIHEAFRSHLGHHQVYSFVNKYDIITLLVVLFILNFFTI